MKKTEIKTIILIILRCVGAAFALLMLGWFIAPIARFRTVNIGNIAGILLCLWTLLLLSPLRRRITALCARHAVSKWLWRAANACFAAFMLYGAVLTGFILAAASRQPQEPATVILLGAEVNPSGKPTLILEGRISAAESYLKEHPEAKAVLTGGKGTNERISEARCMYNELVSCGISADRLYIEDRATDTVENFRYSLSIIEKNGLSRNLAVVTDGFHQFRAGVIARKQGAGESLGCVSAETRWEFIPTYIVREWFAFPPVVFK